MIYSIEQTLTEEGRKELRHSLDHPVERQEYKRLKDDAGKVKSIPASKIGKWKAPPGWTPPGWDEERSYANAKSFIGFQANPK